MKIHTPLFVVGLLVFITPFLGLPRLIEAIILSAFGISIMILVSTIMKRPIKNKPLKITEEESIPEAVAEDVTPETTDEETVE